VGILASISGILTKRKINISAISTYDTDYILIKDNDIKSGTQKSYIFAATLHGRPVMPVYFTG